LVHLLDSPCLSLNAQQGIRFSGASSVEILCQPHTDASLVHIPVLKPLSQFSQPITIAVAGKGGRLQFVCEFVPHPSQYLERAFDFMIYHSDSPCQSYLGGKSTKWPVRIEQIVTAP
ncbi:hypothetical protein, partial [Burkholderia cepacia]|uniref:hypothetical protein n=1 Tax=Burkholderia cepacia TaxID=292 RepID=UPI001C7D5EC6